MAENLVRLRQARGFSTTRLSEALERLGQPIPATGITRIEKGQRRVDTDDLVALALALNVSPLTLLLPAESSDAPVELTDKEQVASRTAWQWAQGLQPAMDRGTDEGTDLAGPGADPAIVAAAVERERKYEQLQAEYKALALPPERRRPDHPSIQIAHQLAEYVEDLVAPEAGAGADVEAARVRSARRRIDYLDVQLKELEEKHDPKPPTRPGGSSEQFREGLAADSKDEPGGK